MDNSSNNISNSRVRAFVLRQIKAQKAKIQLIKDPNALIEIQKSFDWDEVHEAAAKRFHDLEFSSLFLPSVLAKLA